MMATGHKVLRMEKARSTTNQAQSTSESSKKAKDTGVVNIPGPTLKSTTKENSSTGRCMDRALRCGMMGPSTKESGITMNAMEMEHSRVQTE